MKLHCVLISGPTVSCDDALEKGLQTCAMVFKNVDSCGVESTLAERQVDLILFEFCGNNSADIEIIKNIKSRYLKLKIVVLADHANREALAEALAHGAQDAFRKPYIAALIVERVKSLLEQADHAP